MSGIMQAVLGGSFAPAATGPTTIGQAWGGGFYAGKISTAGTGVADYYLIIAPIASGYSGGEVWGPNGTTGFTSVINGPVNSAGESALGAGYGAARFCENLTIGTYSDWYLPSKNELETIYYNLKPDTTANSTVSGSNANAVSPEPVSQNYTSGSPAQTSATNFRTGSTEALVIDLYWTSTEASISGAWAQRTDTGAQSQSGKTGGTSTRAVRRIPI